MAQIAPGRRSRFPVILDGLDEQQREVIISEALAYLGASAPVCNSIAEKMSAQDKSAIDYSLISSNWKSRQARARSLTGSHPWARRC